MSYVRIVFLCVALGGCAMSGPKTPQQAVVESEAARQTAVNAAASGDTADSALEKAATVTPVGAAPKGAD